MLNRIQNLLNKNEKFLSIFLTGGYPTKELTLPLIRKIIDSGAQMIELGFPSSDPIGDGITIQNASTAALKNGVDLNFIFNTVRDVRENDNTTPIILMGYFNQIFQYGIEKFCQRASESGIDGLIIPDLPLTEYQTRCKSYFIKYNLLSVFLLTPETSKERIFELDKETTGFLYAVSSSGTTGGKMAFNSNYLKELKKLPLQNKIGVGFGIKTKEDYNEVTKIADFAIIGSEFIKRISDPKESLKMAEEFIEGILR